jgi:hypothetical protein
MSKKIIILEIKLEGKKNKEPLTFDLLICWLTEQSVPIAIGMLLSTITRLDRILFDF